MKRYTYSGPVSFYDKVISNKWNGETIAESESKALSNLKYQFKNETKMIPGVGGIRLLGKTTSSMV